MVALAQRQKFATQVDGDILNRVRSIATETHTPIQVIVEQALDNYLKEQELTLKQMNERASIMAAWKQSKIDNAQLYKRLAE